MLVLRAFRRRVSSSSSSRYLAFNIFQHSVVWQHCVVRLTPPLAVAGDSKNSAFAALVKEEPGGTAAGPTCNRVNCARLDPAEPTV